MKNVLVTGANGKVGKELCKRLRERDYSVVEFHRTPDSDLTNPNDIKKVFEEGIQSLVDNILNSND